MGTHKQIKAIQINTQNTNLSSILKTLGPTELYEVVLVDVHMENFQCTA